MDTLLIGSFSAGFLPTTLMVV